ncbi:hypothetical protein A3G06_01050 [Candidatus Nomurabacteria bacterium RIFCSPLOWO2_12_FULL_46_14]|uniref:Glycosidase n=1 Tax=Candidatus Nomurabacteria bacterium RIFCSPLOWO2_12_FULL_46_14 TaxID=1801797 RepID=A0A1F6Y8E2_9BACT|nr:MAG: hypothetical protein A3G06_01050 [Candidatus Nomurabacteria bacterium RIFCSPLOWO2_12_FULL_46_14]
MAKLVKKVVGREIRAKSKILRKKPAPKPLSLKRAPQNPIIEPRSYAWESKATFNPAAFLSDGKVYIIYRAIGEDDSSTLGYARSDDGLRIRDRLPYFVYKRWSGGSKPDLSLSPIVYLSGGGWNGGCEDPRLTLLGDRVYMLYTAFDGWGSVRIALTSISLEDFKKKKWNWQKAVMISPPHEIHKNWVLFPEKILGRFAILHSLSPRIKIDYFNSLDELDGKNFIHSVHQGSPEWGKRERGIRGVGPTPIKTRLGWLILYHGIEERDPGQYKLFAMILDAKDPTRIIYRSPSPILEPEKFYENEGHKWGVIYSCGAVVLNKKLFVYYGGADRVACVASIELEDLLEDLRNNKVAKLKNNKLEDVPLPK